ncbi:MULTISPECIES: PH domain-containing protein [unclassified Vibrio]|uniref:PH domain-containing protein n=1 Tax=Vibrio sp. HB236076 TaxID=3232307 RepID=A0AB39HDH4_9VIBR|nr:PH domain-containing protein [Vibrio sp. HB161653]MDP5254120.1 PH domain-containing protein [Vibrio sp. HB161653]
MQYSEHPAMFRNSPLLFILALITIPIGIGLIALLWWYAKCKSIQLEFSGNDLILEKGLLSKDRTELNIDGIRTVNVYQSFFNRVFGVGKIAIYTAGDEPEIEVEGLPRPHELRDLIKSHQAD